MQRKLHAWLHISVKLYKYRNGTFLYMFWLDSASQHRRDFYPHYTRAATDMNWVSHMHVLNGRSGVIMGCLRSVSDWCHLNQSITKKEPLQMPEDSTWTCVLITSNGTGLQNFLSFSSISSFVAQVQQNQVVVRASYKDIRRNSMRLWWYWCIKNSQYIQMSDRVCGKCSELYNDSWL